MRIWAGPGVSGTGVSQGCSHMVARARTTVSLCSWGLAKHPPLPVCGLGATPRGLSAWASWASSQHGSLRKQTTYREVKDFWASVPVNEAESFHEPASEVTSSHVSHIQSQSTSTFKGSMDPTSQWEERQGHVVRMRGTGELVTALLEKYNLPHN